MTPKNLKRKCRDEFCVAIEEEHGYRHHLWFPDVSTDGIEHWWKSLKGVGWIEGRDAATGYIVSDFDVELGDFVYEECQRLWLRPGTYAAYYDGEAETALFTPDGRALFHATFSGPANIKKYLEDWAQVRSKQLIEKARAREHMPLTLEGAESFLQDHFVVPVHSYVFGHDQYLWIPPVASDELEEFWLAQGPFDQEFPRKQIEGVWLSADNLPEDQADQFEHLFWSWALKAERYAIIYDGDRGPALLTRTGDLIRHKGALAWTSKERERLTLMVGKWRQGGLI